jgi:hypothetical protein
VVDLRGAVRRVQRDIVQAAVCYPAANGLRTDAPGVRRCGPWPRATEQVSNAPGITSQHAQTWAMIGVHFLTFGNP